MTKLTSDQALAGATYQHCLSRSGESVEEITTRLIGLHNTSPVSPYLSLRARFPGFRRTDLEDLMWESWRLVRVRAMRLTMFVFPHDLLEIAVAAARHLSESLAERWLRDSKLSAEDVERLTEDVEVALADGPLTVRDLRRKLGVPTDVDLPGVVGRMCDTGRLASGAPPRHWRSPIRQYHLRTDVLPDVDLHRWAEVDAVRELAYRYIWSYGPVTITDIAWWTGLTKARCRAALESLDVEEVEVETWSGPLYRAVGDDVADDPGSEVRALPLLDPYVQGYKARTLPRTGTPRLCL